MPIKKLFFDLAKTKDVVLTVGKDGVVSELTMTRPEITVKNNFLTCQNKNWHIHLNLEKIKKVRFVAEPSHCLQGRMSYSIQFLDTAEKSVLNAYFIHLYDRKKRLIPSKIKTIEKFKKKYARLLGVRSSNLCLK